MIEFLLLDLDDTILDFHMSESVAIRKTLQKAGIDPTEENTALYSTINKRCWEQLEKGEITRDQLKVLRFARLFEALGVEGDAAAIAGDYARQLGIGHYFLPGAEEAVAFLSKRYRLFLASNGIASVQHGRLTSADLYRYFEKVFISEEVGANKPAKEFFDNSFTQIPDFDPKKAMIVGDSLTSDILGGINAGIATCWVNPKHRSARPDIQPDYEIEALHQLPALLEKM